MCYLAEEKPAAIRHGFRNLMSSVSANLVLDLLSLFLDSIFTIIHQVHFGLIKRASQNPEISIFFKFPLFR